MEHKPIYLDGVDVSECLFYQINFEEDHDVKIKHFCSNWHNSCESVNNSDCYFKQLARKTQECEQKEKELKELKRQYKLSCLDCEYKNTKADVKRYRKERDFWKHQAELGSETTDRLAKQLEEKEQECEELKKELNGSEKWRINAESLNEKFDIKNTHYRKALEEIDKVINNIFDRCLGHKTDGCTPVHNVCEELINILDIINKAKDGNNE